MDRAQPVAEHARLAQPLQRVVDADEDGVAGEGEDRGVGVQRTQAAVRERGHTTQQLGKDEFEGDDQADEKRHDAPACRGDRKEPDDGVVVREGLDLRVQLGE